jgi:hypothetical protein
MDATTTALMILLSCSPDTARCREMQAAQSYETIEDCRTNLRQVVQRLTSPTRRVIGRCSLASDELSQPVDPVVTSSVEIPEHHMKTVLVTRFVHGLPVASEHRVPPTD